jgi:hypothetical protein
MPLKEAVSEQVLGQLRLETTSLVLFKRITDCLDSLFTILHQPQLLFLMTQNERYLSAQDKLFRVQMRDEKWYLLEQLHRDGELQIGVAGTYNLYFTRSEKGSIRFVKRENRIYGEPLQANALIQTEFQNALYFLEQFGPVAEVITNQQTGTITLFFQSGGEYSIATSDPHYTEIQALTSGKMVQIGSTLSDRLFFYPPIGYYNGETGARITNLQSEAIRLDGPAQQVINLFFNAQHFRYLPDEHDQSPVVVDTQGSQVRFKASDTPNYLLKQLAERKDPIQVGNCAGSEGIFYLWGAGILTKRVTIQNTARYYEIQAVAPATKHIAPGTHIYTDRENTSVLYVLAPGMRLQKCTANTKYFHIFQQLVEGKVGIIRDEAGEVRFIVFHDEQGIVYQPFSVSEEAIAETLVAQKGTFQLPRVIIQTAQDKAVAAENVPKKPTSREKKRKERHKFLGRK